LLIKEFNNIILFQNFNLGAKMTKDRIKEFQQERLLLNELIMKYSGKNVKRFFNIDMQVYMEGVLSKKVKELMGLVASLVLRCDDCVLYHLIQCHQEGVSDKELEEAIAIGLVVGGSITIPHIRRAYRAWEEIKNSNL
jgi:AhpD family alkylhydroperoxidase